MSTLQLTVPFIKTGKQRLKIRPREIGIWLDDLPYLDIRRASRSASEQLRLMNRQTIAPAVRLTVLDNFLAAWQRLNDSLPVNPAEANTVRPTLNRMCQDAGFGYKIVVDELVNQRSGFIEQRHLPQALLGAIYTLGLQQLNYYDHHKRVPRALWQECLDLFIYAQEHGRAQYQGQLPGIGPVKIEECFKLIALVRLSNPYSIPAGLMPRLAHYFRKHIQLAQVCTSPGGEGKNLNVVLNSQPHCEVQPAPLYLDLSETEQQLALDLQKLQAGCPPPDIGLPEEIPTPILLNTLNKLQKHWKTQAQRKNEREAVHSSIDLVSGLEAAYCMLNRGRCFDPTMFLEPGGDNHIDLGMLPSPAPAANRTVPDPLRSHCTDRSSGGLAIEHRSREYATRQPQAGQLLAVRRPAAQSSQGWVVGICRWLIEAENDQGFDLGFQYLVRQPRAVVMRIPASDGNRGTYQPCIAARQQRGAEPVQSLITATGQLKVGDEVDLYEQVGAQRIRCTELLESGAGFERHLYETL